jgi:tetratricopeptide (TPR) repeat protein
MMKACVIRLWALAVLLGGLILASPVCSEAQVLASPSTTQSVTKSLLEKARDLESRGRMDLAAQTWQQVLLADPGNTEALGGMARAAALKGDNALAQTYVERLRRINPNDPAIAAVANMQAKPHPAAAKTTNNPPSPSQPVWHLGAAEMAAYEALNAKRIDEAEVGFKAILARDPGNPSALAGMGYVRMQQANFLGAISYLEQAKLDTPSDKALSAALDTSRFWFIMGEGQNAVSANDLTTAEKRYHSALELRPDSPEALEGLGGTLLKAQQPKPAATLYERAIAAQPDSTVAWRGLFAAQLQSGNAPRALATERRMPQAVLMQLESDPLFLQSLASAYSAAGHNLDAQKALESAAKLPATADAKGANTDIQTQLAGVLYASGQFDQAADLYRQLLMADNGDTAAMEGLAEVEHAMGHDEQAFATVQTMPPASYAAAMRDPNFEVTVAVIDRSLDKLDAAQDILQTAITQQTNAGQRPSPAIEMQLAEIYIQRGKPQLAYPIYQQMTKENPQRADAWAGLISTLHLTGHDSEAVGQVALIPNSARPQLESNPSYLQTMAAVYAAQGRSREATQFLGRVEQGYAAQRAAPPADLEIQNAWLLYNGMDDARLYRQLMSLGARTDLTDLQRRSVQTIWTNWAIRRANQAATAGNLARSISILNAAAQSFPDNPAVLRELANAYAQAGQSHQAVLIYRSQDMSAASSADYQSAVNAALAANDSKDAELWLHNALAKYPADAQVLLLAAKYEQARGDTARAMQYYRASLKAMPPVTASAHPLLPGAPAPISLPGASPAQDLAVLLAPGAIEPPTYGGTPSLLPPYETSNNGIVPPYMTNPGAAQTAAPTAGPAFEASAATNSQPTPAPTDDVPAADDGYRPFVPFIAPPRPTPPVAVSRNGMPVEVQLGNNTPPPVLPQAEKTDILPTARYVPSNRKAPIILSDPNMAAAQAERTRHQQAEAAAGRIGQSNPPSEDTITGGQVPQPPTPPASQTGVPDTGTQQYPQPRTQPSPVAQTPRNRQPRTESTAPAQAATPSAPPQAPPPDVAPPEPAQPAPANSSVSSSPAINQPAYPIAPPPTDAELAAGNLPSLHGSYGAQAPIPVSPRQQAETGLASLEGTYSGFFGATGIGRYRSGTPGLDRLYDVESPVEASAVFGRSVRLTAIARPVFLNSGVLNPAGFSSTNIPYLGTMPANTANPPAQQYSDGVGGELQLTTRTLSLAAGYTPSNFLVHNVTGRLNWRPLGDHLAIFADRAPVTDTQLSYAGLRDPGVSIVQGPIWGGVIATTGGVRLGFGDPTRGSGFYLSGGGGVLTGRHVLDNQKFGGTAGAFFRVAKWPGTGSLSIGGDFAGMHYAHNEAGLTYGQGGYFSPNWYFVASVPVTFKGAYGSNFHYSATAALGVQTFQQQTAPFYPLDPILQGNFVPPVGVSCSIALQLSYNCGAYPQTITTSFNYAVDAQASYRLADHWYAGGFLRANNTNNYNDVSAGFFLRFTFRSQTTSEGRPTGLFPIQGFRPLQIP